MLHMEQSQQQGFVRPELLLPVPHYLNSDLTEGSGCGLIAPRLNFNPYVRLGELQQALINVR